MARPEAAAAVAAIKAKGFQPEGFTLFAYATIQAFAEGSAPPAPPRTAPPSPRR